jgi:hypothetical protein
MVTIEVLETTSIGVCEGVGALLWQADNAKMKIISTAIKAA